jgi:FkbM family methyltransferase
MRRSLGDRLRQSPIARRGYRAVRELVAPSHLVLIRTTGVQHADGRRARLMSAIGIDLVLDVGANAGQFGRRLRHAGYKGRIVSFEPLREPFKQLARATRRDDRWIAMRLALGESVGSLELHIAANSVSSSPLAMLPMHRRTAPSSGYIGVETAPLARLDDIWDEVVRPGEKVMLKVDTQGFEDRVLRGASGSLDGISAVELELSLVPLYADGADCRSLVDELAARGFDLVSLNPGHSDPITGRLLQVDGVYVRRGLLPEPPS